MKGVFCLIFLIAIPLFSSERIVELPSPIFKGTLSFEEVLTKRRSIREFKEEPINIQELSQLLFAAQGITAKWGGRTAPSAGALYPMEVYVVGGKIKGVDPGIYRYEPNNHRLIKVKDGDKRGDLLKAALFQSPIKKAPLSFVITAIYERTTGKYGERGKRYAILEAGHIAQNILLQAVALNLSGVPVGAFFDEMVKRVLELQEGEEPLYIIPVGRPGP